MSVFSAQAAATTTFNTGRCKLKAVYWVGAATAGTLTFKDNGSSGTQKLLINTPGITTSGETPSCYMLFPDDGISFGTDLYCAVSTTAFVTVFYTKEG
jgi:hypothetical protein